MRQKRLASLGVPSILTAVLVLLILTTGAFAEPGNVDGRNGVNLRDAVMALQVCAGMNPQGIDDTGELETDDNNQIGLEEAIFVLKMLANGGEFTYTISPGSKSFSASGGTGNDTVSYSVEANPATDSKSGTITVAGKAVTKAGDSDLVIFPDPVLESAIREALNKPSGDILKTDLETLTSFSYSGLDKPDSQKIKNIEGMQYCKNLTKLRLVNNQISDISALAGLKSLTSLHLWHNQISDISALAGLKSLTSLHLWHNQISDINAVAGLINLEYLWFSNNQISNISAVSNLKHLVYFVLSGNQISDIGALAGLTSLTHLHLSGNQISDISAAIGLTNLTRLYLRNNQISDIKPLIDNSGIENGDYVGLRNNPLGTTSCAIYVPQLENRGVDLVHDCPPCLYTTSPSSKSFSASGGTYTVSVNASDSTCAWSAFRNTAFDNWVNITSDANGTGNGSVTFTVDPNPENRTRQALLNIATNTFTITQSPALTEHVLFQETFDSSYLNRWGVYNTNIIPTPNDLIFRNTTPIEPDVCGNNGYLYRRNTGDRILSHSSAINTQGYTDLKLTFWYRIDNGGSIEVKEAQNGAWVSIGAVGPSPIGVVGGQGNRHIWAQKEIHLSNKSSTNIQFYFKGVNTTRRLDCIKIVGKR